MKYCIKIYTEGKAYFLHDVNINKPQFLPTTSGMILFDTFRDAKQMLVKIHCTDLNYFIDEVY